MNEAANDLNNPPPTERKRRFGVKIFIALVLAAVIIAALFAVNNIGGGISFSAVKRTWAVITGGASDVGFSFEDGYDAVFADLGGAVVAAGNAGVAVYDEAGHELARDILNMRNPAVAAGGGIAVAYGVGGRGIRVVGETGIIASITFENDIVSCSVGSSSGFLSGGTLFAVCTKGADNYRGQVTVYKLAGNDPEKVYDWFSGDSGYVLAAEISPENDAFAALTLSPQGGRVVFLNLNEKEPSGQYTHAGAAIIEIGYQGGDTVIARTADGLLAIDGTGAAKEIYSFDAKIVAGYSDDGSAIALYFESAAGGGSGELVVLDRKGAELGRMNTSRSLVWLSSYADRIAALWDDGLIIYDRNLRLIVSYPEASGMLRGYSRGGGRAVVFGNREGKAFSGKTE